MSRVSVKATRHTGQWLQVKLDRSLTAAVFRKGGSEKHALN